MNTKPLILNTVIADLSYSIENVERLKESSVNGLIDLDLNKIATALEILQSNRLRLMALLEEQL